MSKEAAYYRLAGRIFADFSGSIAIPAVLGALLGKWLDGRYDTSPRYILLLLVLALTLTAIALSRKAKRYKETYDRLNRS